MIREQSPFDEFRRVLARHIKELKAIRPSDQSTEWYLLRYFRRIHKKVEASTSARDVENTIRAMLRFYLDQVDEGSELEERVAEVLKYHRRSLRLEHNG